MCKSSTPWFNIISSVCETWLLGFVWLLPEILHLTLHWRHLLICIVICYTTDFQQPWWIRLDFLLNLLKIDVNKHASTQLKTGFWWVPCHCDHFKLHCRYTSYRTFWNTFNRAKPKNKIYLQSNRKWSKTETSFMHRKTCIITLRILQVCHQGDCSVFTCKLISFALTFTWWLHLDTPNYLIRAM